MAAVADRWSEWASIILPETYPGKDDAISRALARLTVDQRKALYLRHVCAASPETTADVLGVSLRTARSIYSLAEQHLRAALAGDDAV